MPLTTSPLRDPVAEHDVDREEQRVRERQGDADRLALELDVGEQVDAGDGEREGGAVPQRPRSEHSQCDHGQKLDRCDRAERKSIDREVEAHVHHGKHGAPGNEHPAIAIVEARVRSPGRRQAAKTAAAAAIRSQATPSGSTRAKSSTANAGPR